MGFAQAGDVWRNCFRIVKWCQGSLRIVLI